jgi:peptidoglycan/xylan/chitin deacetylase (PgdA/CDA1 family)
VDTSLLYRSSLPILRRLLPGMVWSGRNPRQVALSFDDGPHSVFTPLLLDRLTELGIPASFFMLGKHLRSAENQRIVQRMIREGHDVGIHGLTHRPFHSMNRHELWREIRTTAHLLAQATGRPWKTFRYVRPPRGLITPCQLTRLRRRGYTVFTCDCLPGDWEKSVLTAEVVRRVVRDVGVNGGFVALHDGVDVDETAGRRVPTVVGEIVEALQGRFEFVTLTAMLREQTVS